MAYWMFDEGLTTAKVIGGVLILIAITLSAVSEKRGA
jgi:drug/metabolite transporter (DMT)-like permease